MSWRTSRGSSYTTPRDPKRVQNPPHVDLSRDLAFLFTVGVNAEHTYYLPCFLGSETYADVVVCRREPGVIGVVGVLTTHSWSTPFTSQLAVVKRERPR